jgi:hypothetical protein
VIHLGPLLIWPLDPSVAFGIAALLIMGVYALAKIFRD